MAKKIVKRRKLKIFHLLIVLLILGGLSFLVYYVLQIPVKNIIIKNTTYINDDLILELGEIKNYPKFILSNSKKIEKKIEASPYIHSCKLSKKLGFIFVLDIEENKPLFYDNSKNKIIFDHMEEKEEGEYFFSIPRLLNYVPDKKYSMFVDGMKKIDSSILSRISDIEYQPNDYDKDRFLLYMNDGNMVYLTLTKFKMINHYVDVLVQLENHKGILYLDNGNHFQIKE
ncbi:MAG: FtsQ-type POTRA domain-containing protein [Bacilli bacterium]|nr:FtsQ-type POTRA domain-containing protein [Bacilli bacterium]